MAIRIIASDIQHTVTLDVPPYGGQVTVSRSGIIAPVDLQADGLVITTPDSKIINDGTIYGGSGGLVPSGIGVYLFGGTLINTGLIAGGANNLPSLTGDPYGGSGVAVLGGTAINSGTIAGGAGAASRYGYGGAGVELVFGTLTNVATITGGAQGGTGVDDAEAPLAGNGAALLKNSGVIAGGAGGQYWAGGVGVGIANGGVLDNGGTIRGGTGGANSPGHARYGGDGVMMSSGFVINSGAIAGGTVGAGAGFIGGDGAAVLDGTFVNSGIVLGGSGNISAVEGNFGGTGVDILDGSVANAGRIAGGAGGANYRGGFGAVVKGGTLTNTGVISGGAAGPLGTERGIGVYLEGGTVSNAGTIAGGSGIGSDYAVRSSSVATTLIIAPGAVFKGLVFGNGTNDTLELASAASAGTISGLGTQFAGFATTEVSAGADWVLPGVNSIEGAASIGGTLALAGTLDLKGVAGGTGDITIGAGATLVVHAATDVADVAFAASGSGHLVVDTTSMPTSEMIGFAAGDTIDLQQSRVRSVSFANGTLTLDNPPGNTIGSLSFLGAYDTANFTLTADGHGGTDIGFTSAAAALANGLQDLLADPQTTQMTASAALAPRPGAVLWPDFTAQLSSAALLLGTTEARVATT